MKWERCELRKQGTFFSKRAQRFVDVARLRFAYFLDPYGKAPPPQSVGISVNSICNLRCVMCDVGQRNEAGEFYEKLMKPDNLDFRDFLRFIDAVSIRNPRVMVSVNSTEPLLYPDLFRLLEHLVRERRLTTNLTTNGYLLGRYAKQLVELEVDRVAISIDGERDTRQDTRS